MEYSTAKGSMWIKVAFASLAFFACLGFFSPQRAHAAKADKAPPPAVEEPVEGTEYVIGPEDVLEISVWKNDDLSREVLVRPDGMITLPLIGDLRAAGSTPSELRDEITEKIREYQKTVTVSVIVNEINSYRIFIVGEILRPGTYQLRRNTTIIQAIAMAGGFNEYASKNKIVIIREGSSGGDGKEKIKVRFKDIVNVKKSKDNNLVLKAGDTIFVP